MAVSCIPNGLFPESFNPGNPTPVVRDSITFSASLEDQETRTVLDGFKILWVEGDLIQVFNASTPQGETFRLSGGAGTKSGTFTGPALAGGGPYYAVYPAKAALSLSGTDLRVSTPGIQTYAVDSFGPGANLSAGWADDLDNIRFLNLLGYMELTLKGPGTLRSIRIQTDREDEHLYGTATVTGLGTEKVPTVTFDPQQTDEDGEPVSRREVILDLGSKGVELSPEGTVFYLTLPADTMDGGFTLEMSDGTGTMFRHGKVSENNRIIRNMILPIPALTFNVDYQEIFLTSEEVQAGVFVHADSATDKQETCCEYEPAQSQFSWLTTDGENGTRQLRIQDWEKGFALTLTLPAVVQIGKTCPVTVEALGNTGGIQSGENIPMKVIKQADGRIWLSDPGTGNGFVIMTED